MKKLVMSALLFGTVAQAAGCIFVSDDSGTSGTATVDVTWTLLDDTAAAGCPAGGDTATIYAQRPEDTSPFTDIYNCSDGGGSAMDLPAGDYTIWVEITDSSGASLYAMSEDATVTLSDGELATANFDIDVANGFFDTSWNINDNTGAPVGCAGVSNNGVSVLSTVSGTTGAVDSEYNCTDGEAPNKITTDAVGIGQIVVSEALLQPGTGGGAIGQSADINTEIMYGNQFVDLGTVDINLF